MFANILGRKVPDNKSDMMIKGSVMNTQPIPEEEFSDPEDEDGFGSPPSASPTPSSAPDDEDFPEDEDFEEDDDFTSPPPTDEDIDASLPPPSSPPLSDRDEDEDDGPGPFESESDLDSPPPAPPRHRKGPVSPESDEEDGPPPPPPVAAAGKGVGRPPQPPAMREMEMDSSIGPVVEEAPAPKPVTLSQPPPSATLTQPPLPLPLPLPPTATATLTAPLGPPPAKLLLLPKKADPAPAAGEQVAPPQVEVRRLSLNMGLAIKEPPNLNAKTPAAAAAVAPPPAGPVSRGKSIFQLVSSSESWDNSPLPTPFQTQAADPFDAVSVDSLSSPTKAIAEDDDNKSAVSQLSASTRQSIASASVAGSGRRRSVKDLLDIKAEYEGDPYETMFLKVEKPEASSQ
eukprot:gene35698-46308_t